MLALLLLACATDADYDGFTAKDDCDDSDPYTYPGAPDDPADGIDADCDGKDPDHAFVGGWEVETFTANYSSFALLVPGSEEGELEIGADMLVTADISAMLDPDLVGGTFPIDLALAGDASPLAGPAALDIYLDGEAFGEDVFMDMACAVTEDDTLECLGNLKALDAGLNAAATFTRQ